MNFAASTPLSNSHKQLAIAAAIAFFMLLTRGSHVLSAVSLPDASLVLFLLAGLYLKRAGWFILFFILAAVILFGWDAGVIIATYERNGEVQTGTFATKPPSAAEVERVAKWQREG